MKTPPLLHRTLGATATVCRLLALILSIQFASNAVATEYYVDPVSGDDLNNGTSTATAFKHLQRIVSGASGTGVTNAVAGDVIYLRGGIHRFGKAQTVTGTTVGTMTAALSKACTTDYGDAGRAVAYLGVSGNAEHPITIKAYGDEKPILKGSLPVTGWTKLTDGDLTTLGLSPATYHGNVYKSTGWQVEGGQLDLASVWATNSGATPTWHSYFSNPQELYVSDDPTIDGYKLRRVNSKFTVSDLASGTHWWDYLGANFDIIGSGALTDLIEGSFFYDENTGTDKSDIYVWLKDNADPGEKTVEATTSTNLIHAKSGGGNYITLEGLTFRHSNTTSDDSPIVAVLLYENAHVNKCDIQWMDLDAFAVWGDSVIENSTISNNGRTGFGTQHEHVTVRNCEFKYNYNTPHNPQWAANAVYAHCGAMKNTSYPSMLIENCRFIGNIVGVWFDSIGLTDDWDGHPAITIRNNYFEDNYEPFFYEVCATPCLVSDNIFYKNSYLAIMLSGSSNCVIQHNLIANNRSDSNGGDATIFLHWDSRSGASKNNRVVENIFYENLTDWIFSADRNGYRYGGTADANINNEIDHNLYYGSTSARRLFYSDNNMTAPVLMPFSRWQSAVVAGGPPITGGSGHDVHSEMTENLPAFYAAYTSADPGKTDFSVLSRQVRAQIGKFMAASVGNTPFPSTSLWDSVGALNLDVGNVAVIPNIGTKSISQWLADNFTDAPGINSAGGVGKFISDLDRDVTALEEWNSLFNTHQVRRADWAASIAASTGSGSLSRTQAGKYQLFAANGLSNYARVDVFDSITDPTSTSGVGINFNCPITLSFTGSVFPSAHTRVRILVGQSTAALKFANEDALTQKGFGVEIFESSTAGLFKCKIIAHNGTAYYSSSDVDLGAWNNKVSFVLRSDGHGNLKLWGTSGVPAHRPPSGYATDGSINGQLATLATNGPIGFGPGSSGGEVPSRFVTCVSLAENGSGTARTDGFANITEIISMGLYVEDPVTNP